MTKPIYRKIIGADFSIKKPAVCIYDGKNYSFISWPHELSPKIVNLMRESGVNVIDRTDVRTKENDVSEKMRNEVRNAMYLAKLICDTLAPHLTTDTAISFEGLSYGSSGDAQLQLSSYKYMLMAELSKRVPLENMFTYSPISIKSVAGCSKKGMTKSDVIESFLVNSNETVFANEVRKNRTAFKKKNSENWVDHLDDIVDSYWVTETLRVKEGVL